MKLQKTYLVLITALFFGSQAWAGNCTAAWDQLNQRQLDLNFGALETDVKIKLINAFAANGIFLNSSDVTFKPNLISQSFEQSAPQSGYYLNVYALSSAIVQYNGKSYEYVLDPSYDYEFVPRPMKTLVLVTFVNEKIKSNSIGDILGVTCSSKSQFTAFSDANMYRAFLIQYDIVRTESHVKVGQTKSLKGQQEYSYVGTEIIEITP